VEANSDREVTRMNGNKNLTQGHKADFAPSPPLATSASGAKVKATTADELGFTRIGLGASEVTGEARYVSSDLCVLRVFVVRSHD
jgi:hypothetical protein